MRSQMLFLAAGLLLGASFAGVALSQDAGGGTTEGGKPEQGAGSGGMNDPEMMKAWMKAMTPGPQHARMAARAGAWTAAGKMWMDPAGQPAPITGSGTFRMALGGRYQVQEYRGSMMGMAFEGMGIHGYDNVKQKHFSAWIDSMGTGVWFAEGTEDEKGVISCAGPMTDPSGQTCIMREQITPKDADHFLFEMFYTDPKTSQEVKNMEMEYTRSAAK